MMLNNPAPFENSITIKNVTREIPMDGISKIEIQDSGKVYKYQN